MGSFIDFLLKGERLSSTVKGKHEKEPHLHHDVYGIFKFGRMWIEGKKIRCGDRNLCLKTNGTQIKGWIRAQGSCEVLFGLKYTRL